MILVRRNLLKGRGPHKAMNAIRWRILEIILEATYRGIPWRSGGKDSPLALQWAWG